MWSGVEPAAIMVRRLDGSETLRQQKANPAARNPAATMAKVELAFCLAYACALRRRRAEIQRICLI